ncbi:hypothetical protein, partial [Curtobacterium sp. MCBA15_001]|uniref:hypothetical protein n=1 Tax=Curtobacterium sp. MCBA15_001 TaxID=1898731 RepID=UPI00111452F3
MTDVTDRSVTETVRSDPIVRVATVRRVVDSATVDSVLIARVGRAGIVRRTTRTGPAAMGIVR